MLSVSDEIISLRTEAEGLWDKLKNNRTREGQELNDLPRRSGNAFKGERLLIIVYDRWWYRRCYLRILFCSCLNLQQCLLRFISGDLLMRDESRSEMKYMLGWGCLSTLRKDSVYRSAPGREFDDCERRRHESLWWWASSVVWKVTLKMKLIVLRSRIEFERRYEFVEAQRSWMNEPLKGLIG